MNLIAWLQSLGEMCRDDIPAGAMAEWAEMMQRWKFSDEEWAELKRRVTRCHRGGPVRFAQIEEHADDLYEERERRENTERVRRMFEEAKRDPCPPKAMPWGDAPGGAPGPP